MATGGNTPFAQLFSVPCGPDVIGMRRGVSAAFFFKSLEGDPRHEAPLDDPKNLGPLFRASGASRRRCPARGLSSDRGFGQSCIPLACGHRMGPRTPTRVFLNQASSFDINE